MLNRVTSSYLFGIMMANKCSKFKAIYQWTWEIFAVYENFNQNSKLKKGHNSAKMLDRVTSSCLQVGIMMVIKCSKYKRHISMDLGNI